MGDYSSENIVVTRCPFLGRIHFVRDTMGYIQISFIIWYWIYGSSVTMGFILLPRHEEGHVSIIFILTYCFMSIMTISCLARAATTNPGRIPLVPEESVRPDQLNWTHCKVCLTRRPIRSHHCRRCKQCVLRMDHHCPWINNCVGEANHWCFMQLLFYAFMLSFLTLIECILHFYFYPKCKVCDYTNNWFFQHERAFLYLLTSLAALMSLFMFCMFGTQHLQFLLDRTTLDNIREPFPKEIPYQKRPCIVIYEEVFGPGNKLMYLFPCRRRRTPPVYVYPDLV